MYMQMRTGNEKEGRESFVLYCLGCSLPVGLVWARFFRTGTVSSV